MFPRPSPLPDPSVDAPLSEAVPFVKNFIGAWEKSRGGDEFCRGDMRKVHHELRVVSPEYTGQGGVIVDDLFGAGLQQIPA
jgi:hypothetical protein